MNNSDSLSVDSDEKITATDVAKCLGLKRDEVLEFLRLRGYIMRDQPKRKRKGDYYGTALGIEKGYVENYLYTTDGKDSYIHFYLTKKGMEKVKNAFFIEKPTQEEKERINKLCMEAERNMKPSLLGKAE